jgi:hypothetical protein
VRDFSRKSRSESLESITFVILDQSRVGCLIRAVSKPNSGLPDLGSMQNLRDLKRDAEEILVVAAPGAMQGECVAPFRHFDFVGIAVADASFGVLRQQISAAVAEKSVEVFGVIRPYDTAGSVVDEDRGRQHIASQHLPDQYAKLLEWDAERLAWLFV